MQAKYVKDNGLGGMMTWTLDLDDFNNICCKGTFPLVRAVNKELGRDVPPGVADCTKPPPVVTPAPAELTTTPDTGISLGDVPF